MDLLATIRRTALRSLIPPPRLKLSSTSAGTMVRLSPYQREIADAIPDPEIERDVFDSGADANVCAGSESACAVS